MFLCYVLLCSFFFSLVPPYFILHTVNFQFMIYEISRHFSNMDNNNVKSVLGKRSNEEKEETDQSSSTDLSTSKDSVIHMPSSSKTNTTHSSKQLKTNTTSLTLIIQSYNNPKHVREIYQTLIKHSATIPHVVIYMVILEKGSTTFDEFHLIPSISITTTYHKLSNNGREYGAYLWYTSTFYDTLNGCYVFTSANLPKHDRRKRLKNALILSSKLNNDEPFPLPRRSGRKRTGKGGVDYSFTEEEYMGQIQTPAEVRPFGAWFEQCVCMKESKPFHETWKGQTDEFSNGLVVSIGMKIKNRLNKKHWIDLYEQTERGGNAPEVGHYLEKASYWLWAPY